MTLGYGPVPARYVPQPRADQRRQSYSASGRVGELRGLAAGSQDGKSALDRHAAVMAVEPQVHLILGGLGVDERRVLERRQGELVREPVHQKIIAHMSVRLHVA